MIKKNAHNKPQRTKKKLFKRIAEKLLERNFLFFVTISLFLIMYLAGLLSI